MSLFIGREGKKKKGVKAINAVKKCVKRFLTLPPSKNVLFMVQTSGQRLLV